MKVKIEYIKYIPKQESLNIDINALIESAEDFYMLTDSNPYLYLEDVSDIDKIIRNI